MFCHTLGAGSFLHCLAALLGLSSGRRMPTSGPHLVLVSAVTVCPHRFPIDFSALGAYVPFLWSTWCASWSRHLLRPCSASIGVASACWVLSRRLSGLRLVALGEEQTKDPFPPSAFEKRVHHAAPKQHAVLNLPVCCLQPKKPTTIFGEFWVKNRLRTPPPRRQLKREFIMRFPGNMQS